MTFAGWTLAQLLPVPGRLPVAHRRRAVALGQAVEVDDLDTEVVLSRVPVLEQERIRLAGPQRSAYWLRLRASMGPVDLVVTVCDVAHEELGDVPTLHWSIPDPAGSRSPGFMPEARPSTAKKASESHPRAGPSWASTTVSAYTRLIAWTTG